MIETMCDEKGWAKKAEQDYNQILPKVVLQRERSYIQVWSERHFQPEIE
jgi:hypothetical protein